MGGNKSSNEWTQGFYWVEVMGVMLVFVSDCNGLVLKLLKKALIFLDFFFNPILI
jgi:hypothetical protein